MTLWQIILVASIAVLGLKLVGYLVPPRVLETPTAARTANLVTVALLSALIVVQTASIGQNLVLDAGYRRLSSPRVCWRCARRSSS